MKKKYLVVLKNPPVSFMVDGYTDDRFLKRMKMASFIQEGLNLWIPVNSDCTIAYIQEMSQEDIEAVEARLLEQRAKIVKPKFKFPVGKPS